MKARDWFNRAVEAFNESQIIPEKFENKEELTPANFKTIVNAFMDKIELVPETKENLLPKVVITFYNGVVDGIIDISDPDSSILGDKSSKTEPKPTPQDQPKQQEAKVEEESEKQLTQESQEPEKAKPGKQEEIVIKEEAEVKKEVQEKPSQEIKPEEKPKSKPRKGTSVFGRRLSSKYGQLDEMLLSGATMQDMVQMLKDKFDMQDEKKAEKTIKAHIRNTIKQGLADEAVEGDVIKLIPKDSE